MDDMFVIVQAWDNLPPEVHQNRDVAERIGLALKHAVSIIFLIFLFFILLCLCLHVAMCK